MKTTPILIFIFALIITLAGCGQQSGIDRASVDANTFDKMAHDQKDEAIILDVRTPEEFSQGHIHDAVLINVKDDDFQSRVNKLDKSKTILVYCSAGVRSEKASGILRQSGFKNVYHLHEGLKGWEASGKKLTTE